MTLLHTLVAIEAHRTVPLVVSAFGGIGTVDRQLEVVGSKTMAVGVWVGEETTLWWKSRRGNEKRAREGGEIGDREREGERKRENGERREREREKRKRMF